MSRYDGITFTTDLSTLMRAERKNPIDDVTRPKLTQTARFFVGAARGISI